MAAGLLILTTNSQSMDLPASYMHVSIYLTSTRPISTGIHKPRDLSFCFFPLRAFRNCPLDLCPSGEAATCDLLCNSRSIGGLMFAPQTSSTSLPSTASPAARIFRAALISRSWCVPHWGQSHERIFNGNLSTT